jgi:uncharacterized protein YfaP (DUF2135 family)
LKNSSARRAFSSYSGETVTARVRSIDETDDERTELDLSVGAIVVGVVEDCGESPFVEDDSRRDV